MTWSTISNIYIDKLGSYEVKETYEIENGYWRFLKRKETNPPITYDAWAIEIQEHLQNNRENTNRVFSSFDKEALDKIWEQREKYNVGDDILVPNHVNVNRVAPLNKQR